MIKLFSTIILLTSVWMISCSPEKNKEQKPLRPNIIFIMADDLGYGDLGVYGQQLIKTPSIDRMAAEGMLFSQFYAGGTVCAPSRSALMTGLHTGHTRIRGNAAGAALHLEDTTLATILKAAGYKTALIGKWGLGDEGSTGLPNQKGFDYFYGFLNQTHAHNHYPSYLWENDRRDSLRNKVKYVPNNFTGVAISRVDYAEDKFMEKTSRFLHENKNNRFFLYLALTLPHANNEAKYFKQSGMEVPDTQAYDTASWPTVQKEHAAMITYLDRDVGKILDQLKVLGLDENTLVIFTSDNGPHDEGGADHTFFKSAGLLHGAKRDLYEGGIRVPFIARWPGHIAAATRSNLVAAFWDVMPTLSDIAGAKTPRMTDGISMLPTLLGDSTLQQKHDFLYWEFFEQGGKQALLMNPWKCILLNVDKPVAGDTLLFNLLKDPAEQNNVFSQHRDIVAQACQIMKEQHTYSPDFHFENESVNSKR